MSKNNGRKKGMRLWSHESSQRFVNQWECFSDKRIASNQLAFTNQDETRHWMPADHKTGRKKHKGNWDFIDCSPQSAIHLQASNSLSNSPPQSSSVLQSASPPPSSPITTIDNASNPKYSKKHSDPSYHEIMKGFKPVAPKISGNIEVPNLIPQVQNVFSFHQTTYPSNTLPVINASHARMVHHQRPYYNSESSLPPTLTAAPNVQYMLPVTYHKSSNNIGDRQDTDDVVSHKIEKLKKTMDEAIQKSKTLSREQSSAINCEAEIIVKEELLSDSELSPDEENYELDQSFISSPFSTFGTQEKGSQTLDTNTDMLPCDYCLKITHQLVLKFPTLMVNSVDYGKDRMLIVYPKIPLLFPDDDGDPYIDYVRLVIKSDETYKFQVLHKDIQTGRFDRKSIKKVLEIMTCNTYVLCRGLPMLRKYDNFIDLETKRHIRNWVGIDRVDTKSCLLWHRTSQKASLDSEVYHVCRICRELLYSLKRKQISVESNQ